MALGGNMVLAESISTIAMRMLIVAIEEDLQHPQQPQPKRTETPTTGKHKLGTFFRSTEDVTVEKARARAAT
jgi:hypothetical protein